MFPDRTCLSSKRVEKFKPDGHIFGVNPGGSQLVSIRIVGLRQNMNFENLDLPVKLLNKLKNKHIIFSIHIRIEYNILKVNFRVSKNLNKT